MHGAHSPHTPFSSRSENTSSCWSHARARPGSLPPAASHRPRRFSCPLSSLLPLSAGRCFCETRADKLALSAGTWTCLLDPPSFSEGGGAPPPGQAEAPESSWARQQHPPLENSKSEHTLLPAPLALLLVRHPGMPASGTALASGSRLCPEPASSPLDGTPQWPPPAAALPPFPLAPGPHQRFPREMAVVSLGYPAGSTFTGSWRLHEEPQAPLWIFLGRPMWEQPEISVSQLMIKSAFCHLTGLSPAGAPAYTRRPQLSDGLAALQRGWQLTGFRTGKEATG